MEKPLVSVIIPTHNGARYIKKALESVFAQTYENVEVIVVNDGSSDDTLNLINEFAGSDPRFCVLNNEKNMGFVKSLNRGASAASGKYIARIDDDDIWIDKNKLVKQIDFLESHKDYVLVGGGVVVKREFDGKEVIRYLFPEEDKEIRNSLLMYNLFLHSAVVFLKSAYEKAGEYDEEFGFFADIALWLKMGLIGKFYNFQEYFTVYLDKEDGHKNNSMRDRYIRRRLFSRIKLKWRYRKAYPNFTKSLLFCMGSYVYSFIPFKAKIRPFLFKARIIILGTPYKYFRIKSE